MSFWNQSNVPDNIYEVHLDEQSDKLVQVNNELGTTTTQSSTFKEIRCIICWHDKKVEEKNMMHIFNEANSLKIKSSKNIKKLFMLKKQVDKLQIKKKKLV